ncbi:TniQ family protein [Paenibacillus sp. MMS20-IR301]|uniref:TniQ family protein n=1 Tax=Paenibacillus sp. MMS20-IR301 TaxID=2895946 RepID=UPI0028EBA879|nr:TniQ family protein [Paenibacillus sp. MMS20-IR301]WNS46107.1 TniQ family protein [Paenibacillus sp. MMS20-IR301]
MNQIPWIFPNESLSSYLQRLLRANGHFNVSIMADDLSISVADINNNDFTMDAIKLVADITGFDIQELVSMSSHGFKTSMGANAYEKIAFRNKAKYCPICIQQDHYYKSIWTLYPVAVCLEHETLLIEECQFCFRDLSMNTFMDGYCLHCGFEYKYAALQLVNRDSLLFQAQLELQRLIEEGECSLFGNLSLANYLQLSSRSMFIIEGLTRHTDYKKPVVGFYNKEGRDKTTENSAHAYASVHFMYEAFPNHFIQVLDAFQKKDPSIKYMQKPEFEKLLWRPEFKVIKKAYQTYWVNQADSGNVRADFSVFKEEPSLLGKRTHLSREEVKNKYGLTYEKINSLNRYGALQTKIIPKQKINRYRIEKKILEATVKQMKCFVTRSEAAKMLGFQRDTVSKLISAGILRLSRSPDGSNKLLRDEVNNLISRCRNKMVPFKSPTMISFDKAFEKYNHCGLSFALLIEFTLKNDLKTMSYGNTGTLKDVYYDENDLILRMKQIKKENQTKNGYFMTDLQEIFRVGEKTIWTMATHHILTPDKVITLKDGRKQYVYDKEKVDVFKQNHLTISEAAMQFGISDATIRRWLVIGRLKDVMMGLSKSKLINVDQLREALSIKSHHNQKTS